MAAKCITSRPLPFIRTGQPLHPALTVAGSACAGYADPGTLAIKRQMGAAHSAFANQTTPIALTGSQPLLTLITDF